MKCSILTLFPGIIKPVLNESILKKAQEKGLFKAEIYNIRDYTEGRHKVADDYPYGGGAGMVMKPEPIFRLIDSLRDRENGLRIILPSPQGRRFGQDIALEISREDRKIIFICGHYEGIDERIIRGLKPEEVSVGDYVLTGGELASLVMIDAAVRLIPGVVGNIESIKEESFSPFLDYPHYTRPSEFRGMTVPDVLLSGNHREIKRWRKKEGLRNTYRKRPDLFDKIALDDEERLLLEEIKGEKAVSS